MAFYAVPFFRDAVNAETYLLHVLEMDTSDDARRQHRILARQHLIDLYRDLGRHRESDAHRRALTIEAPEFSRRLEISVLSE